MFDFSVSILFVLYVFWQFKWVPKMHVVFGAWLCIHCRGKTASDVCTQGIMGECISLA